jgi:uncharacterized C2H2 Zn-finger protein
MYTKYVQAIKEKESENVFACPRLGVLFYEKKNGIRSNLFHLKTVQCAKKVV